MPCRLIAGVYQEQSRVCVGFLWANTSKADVWFADQDSDPVPIRNEGGFEVVAGHVSAPQRLSRLANHILKASAVDGR